MNLFGKSLTQLSDEELFSKIQEGNERAFAELYNRYNKWLMQYFYRMLWKNKGMAEDAVQDFFTKLATNPNLYDGARSFKTWAFSVANNMCKNHYRHKEVVDRAAPKISQSLEVSENQDGASQQDRDVFMNTLEEELMLLDDEKRSTFVLRFFDELSIKEIAEVMDCSEGTVKSRVFYTLQHLSKRLKHFEHLLKKELV